MIAPDFIIVLLVVDALPKVGMGGLDDVGELSVMPLLFLVALHADDLFLDPEPESGFALAFTFAFFLCLSLSEPQGLKTGLLVNCHSSCFKS